MTLWFREVITFTSCVNNKFCLGYIGLSTPVPNLKCRLIVQKILRHVEVDPDNSLQTQRQNFGYIWEVISTSHVSCFIGKMPVITFDYHIYIRVINKRGCVDQPDHTESKSCLNGQLFLFDSSVKHDILIFIKDETAWGNGTWIKRIIPIQTDFYLCKSV